MDFLERLKMLANARGYTNTMQLSKASGVPYTTIDGFSRVGYDNVKLSTLRKLCACLNCSLEYLVNGDSDIPSQPSPVAIDLAHQYDQLDPHGKQVVSAVTKLEAERCSQSIEALNDRINAAVSVHRDKTMPKAE